MFFDLNAALQSADSLVTALEEDQTGEVAREKERVFVGRIIDPEQLKKAQTVVTQEQWTVFVERTPSNAGEGQLRIRKTTDQDGEVSYTQTTKVRFGPGDNDEGSVASTQAIFELYEKLASEGMYKRRYTFPIEGTELKWEVDVFLRNDGKAFEWCKIDLEGQITDIPPLPIDLEGVIVLTNPDKTAEQEALVERLFNEVFSRKNIYAYPHGTQGIDTAGNLNVQAERQAQIEPGQDTREDGSPSAD